MKKVLSRLFSAVGVASLIATTSLTAFAADVEPPSPVENLQATAQNGAVHLTWDEATDDTGVAGYQVHYDVSPVTKTGESYSNVEDVKDVVEFTVEGLDNGTKYYFSVIAYDAAGNESQKWAKEASATPSGDIVDEEAPQVSEAEALNKEEVKVVFTEAVVLPEEDPENEFDILSDDTFEPLVVLDAIMDEDDRTNKTVILTTGDQNDGENYVLTVGIGVEDMAGNSIISGTSDTAAFVGNGDEKPLEDMEGPELVSIEVVDNENIKVYFNEAVVLGIDPAENFVIAEESDPTKFLEVLGVELIAGKNRVEDAGVAIKTSKQTDETSYVLTVVDLEDEAGNVVSDAKSSGLFAGVAAGEVVTPPVTNLTPEDVAEFMANAVLEGDKYIVKLTWSVPEGNLGKTVKQMLYLSTDETNFSEKSALDPEASGYDVKDLAARDYWFKLTQEDSQGNETAGVIAKVSLSETGPGMAGLAIVSLGLGRVFRRKRK